jgi:hypothetical protein
MEIPSVWKQVPVVTPLSSSTLHWYHRHQSGGGFSTENIRTHMKKSRDAKQKHLLRIRHFGSACITERLAVVFVNKYRRARPPRLAIHGGGELTDSRTDAAALS